MRRIENSLYIVQLFYANILKHDLWFCCNFRQNCRSKVATAQQDISYCGTFGKAAILSGALHFYEYPVGWVKTEGNTIGEVRNFGDLEETRNTDRNPRYLMQEILDDPAKQFPSFYIACGLQDVLLEANRSIAKALTDAGADVTYEEGEGFHDWDFWNEYIQHVLQWLDYPATSKE